MDIKAANRKFVEEMSLRKANADTQFFWTQVNRNRHHQNPKFQLNLTGKRMRAKEERELFESSGDLKKGVIEDSIPVERSGPLATEIDVLSTFADLNHLPPFVIRNIQLMRYQLPTPIQKHAVPFGLFGLDLMCCAQTGSGKTMAFLLPVIDFLSRPFDSLENKTLPIDVANGRKPFVYLNEAFEANGLFNIPERLQIDENIGVLPRAVVLAPTRELASQIHVEARKLCFGSDIKSVCVYGGADIRSQLVELSTGCDLIVATPGRLTDLVDRGIVSLSQVEFLVLDEADRMLDMGFEPQIRRIVQECDMPDKYYRQTFLFSATFPAEVQTLAREFLREYIWIGVGRVGSTVDNIRQNILLSSSDPAVKLQLLSEAIYLTEGRTLVFVQRKKTATWVCTFLNRQLHVAAEEIHGDRTQQQRENALKSFRDGRTMILVATDVAARGLDIPEVTHVIQFDLPISADDFDTYVHRMGRTGRLGKQGLATAFFVPGRETGEGNGKIAPLILRLLKENQQVIPDWFLAIEDNARYDHGGRHQYSNSRFGGRDNRSNYQTNRYDGSSSAGGGYRNYGSQHASYQQQHFQQQLHQRSSLGQGGPRFQQYRSQPPHGRSYDHAQTQHSHLSMHGRGTSTDGYPPNFAQNAQFPTTVYTVASDAAFNDTEESGRLAGHDMVTIEVIGGPPPQSRPHVAYQQAGRLNHESSMGSSSEQIQTSESGGPSNGQPHVVAPDSSGHENRSDMIPPTLTIPDPNVDQSQSFGDKDVGISEMRGSDLRRPQQVSMALPMQGAMRQVMNPGRPQNGVYRQQDGYYAAPPPPPQQHQFVHQPVQQQFRRQQYQEPMVIPPASMGARMPPQQQHQHQQQRQYQQPFQQRQPQVQYTQYAPTGGSGMGSSNQGYISHGSQPRYAPMSGASQNMYSQNPGGYSHQRSASTPMMVLNGGMTLPVAMQHPMSVSGDYHQPKGKVGNPDVPDFKPSAATMARAQAAYARNVHQDYAQDYGPTGHSSSAMYVSGQQPETAQMYQQDYHGTAESNGAY